MKMDIDNTEYCTASANVLKGINVLVITTGHFATDHRVYSKMACSLKRMGADVVVVGMLEHNIPGEVKIISVPRPSSRAKQILLQPWRCLFAAKKFNADIVHFHDPEVLAVLPVARLIWPGRKFIYDVHEDIANLLLVRDYLPSYLKKSASRLTGFVEKTLSLFASAIVSVTPLLTDKFKNKERETAYNFIERDFFQKIKFLSKEPLERKFDLIHLGTLNMRRAMFLSEVIQEFYKMRPDAQIIVIGVSDHIKQKLISSLPVNCQVTGKIPHHEIPQILGDAKVGIDIHPWIYPHLEVALPVKVCEYMTSGCAVVASTMPVLQQILAKSEKKLNGISVIESDDPADYAGSILQLIESIDKGENPGRELQEFASYHLLWENEAEKVANLYLRLLDRQ